MFHKEVVNHFHSSETFEQGFLIMLAQQEDEEIFKTTRDDLPSDMSKYKFLLNPVRLNIMKLLYDNYNLSSVQIKNNLNLSWSDYSHNILALEEREYVIVQTMFQYGTKRTMVYLGDKGKEYYENLIELLHEFLQKQDEDYITSLSEDSDLYPET
ncbi:MAG: transcriptional regulator [Candidatus Kariarchaeaceae archaeon]